MKALILAMLAILTSVDLAAEEQTFIREYSYQASDHDSRVTARNRALGLLKAEVVEEITSFVRSENILQESLVNGQQNTNFKQQINTLSAGFVKSKILDERWNGSKFWLKARITVDPQQIENEIRRQLESATAYSYPSAGATAQNPAPVVANPQLTAPTANYSHYTQAAYLGQALSLLAPIKMQVIQFYMMEGYWPQSLNDIGFSEDEMSDDTTIEQVALAEEGSLVVALHHRFGKDKWLRMDQEIIMGGTNIRSKCSSNVERKVTSLISGCESVAP